MQIGAADAAIMDLQDDFASAGLRLGHGLDLKRLAEFVKDGGLHVRLLPERSRTAWIFSAFMSYNFFIQ
jgi:hypothetical protein